MNIIKNRQFKYEEALKYEIFVKGEYDFAKEKIQRADCVFDIGGHIGLFSQWCRIMNGNATIHYFEPVEQFYNKAKFILENDKNIIFNNYGIGLKTESGIILLNSEKTMQSSKYSSFLNPKGAEISVNFITLKNYLLQNNIDKIDVLKMDIEGMEFEVLSSRGDFEWKKIDSFVAEFHILNERMKSDWEQIFLKIRDIFGDVKIIYSGYCKEIFLVRANKIS